MKCSKSSVVFQTCADAEKLSAVSTPSLMTCCSVSVDRQVEDQMLPYHVFFRARVLAIMLRSSMGAHSTIFGHPNLLVAGRRLATQFCSLTRRRNYT